jgi:hypothetical protein
MSNTRTAGSILLDCKQKKAVMMDNKLHKGCKSNLKILTKTKREFEKTSEIREGFCFAISVTHLNDSDTGKNDDNKRP